MRLPEAQPRRRASLTTLPKGPLNAEQSQRLMLKLRRSELNNYKAVYERDRYYARVRRHFNRKAGK